MTETVVEIESPKTGEVARAVYEHAWAVRFSHWLNAVSLLVMVASGFQIFRAFPSFGAKIPQKDLLNWPKAFALGGWLGGGLQWHLTFMWIYVATGLFYLGYQMFSLNYRQVLFMPRDVRGVWPMVRYYFFFGPKPVVREVYNPLQKLAYTSVVCVDRVGGVEAGAVFLAGLDDGWLPLGPDMAFCRDVGDSVLPSGTPCHGRSPRLE
jgi:thiosulfate reductase cytochrome b subunit